eukprot:CAMPEP_0195618044 /NCGR_PEP_ID=MMETSP0815-20121206/13879_1 /TAXON_ID=97485 /ORGANISM="Prymnesium parvum, Strain Texoma1" /LENGTH=97 /DNA_ID=CAMNT_0040758567 /DNA_START=833 /DNA_END=1123 /DNA_ORIENTATION=-
MIRRRGGGAQYGLGSTGRSTDSSSEDSGVACLLVVRASSSSSITEKGTQFIGDALMLRKLSRAELSGARAVSMVAVVPALSDRTMGIAIASVLTEPL